MQILAGEPGTVTTTVAYQLYYQSLHFAKFQLSGAFLLKQMPKKQTEFVLFPKQNKSGFVFHYQTKTNEIDYIFHDEN